MIRILLIFALIGSASLAQAQNKNILYACQIEDTWLQGKQLTARLEVFDFERALITLKSSTETFTCPLSVETIQDASRGRIARVVISMKPESCTPQEKLYTSKLRRHVDLFIDAHPQATGEAQVSWRQLGSRAECKETVNNLHSQGLGHRYPQSTRPPIDTQKQGKPHSQRPPGK